MLCSSCPTSKHWTSPIKWPAGPPHIPPPIWGSAGILCSMVSLETAHRGPCSSQAAFSEWHVATKSRVQGTSRSVQILQAATGELQFRILLLNMSWLGKARCQRQTSYRGLEPMPYNSWKRERGEVEAEYICLESP